MYIIYVCMRVCVCSYWSNPDLMIFMSQTHPGSSPVPCTVPSLATLLFQSSRRCKAVPFFSLCCSKA